MASGSNNDANFVALMREGLESQIKDLIAEEIIGKYVVQAEAEIRAVVGERLSKYTFERIETWREMMELRDRMLIEISVDGEVRADKEIPS